MQLLPSQVLRIVDAALEEDLAWGDPTTDSLIDPSLQATAYVVVKAGGIIAGLPVAALVFQRLDACIQTRVLIPDGSPVHLGDQVAIVSGPASGILKGERTALNFLQRMSGIASQTAKYVAAVKGLPVQIVDTRKTAPGLRMLDKYAVRLGGGHNHRQCLGDGVLIKDNHLAAAKAAGMGLAEVIREVRQKAPHTLKVEIEVECVSQALEATEAGADIIMLDNMPLEELRQVVQLLKGKVLLEASGGITLDNVRAVAETGVDLISSGLLTHSVKALDVSLDFPAIGGG